MDFRRKVRKALSTGAAKTRDLSTKERSGARLPADQAERARATVWQEGKDGLVRLDEGWREALAT